MYFQRFLNIITSFDVSNCFVGKSVQHWGTLYDHKIIFEQFFGGAGGSFLIEELERGAVGTMPWASIPEAYKSPLDLFFDNKVNEARNHIYRFEPILRTLSQPGVGFSLTKEILKMRGVFKTTNVRRPYDALDSSTIIETHRMVDELQLSKY